MDRRISGVLLQSLSFLITNTYLIWNSSELTCVLDVIESTTIAYIFIVPCQFGQGVHYPNLK